MKANADNAGIQCLLIMVDNEGFLGSPDDSERHQAVDNHRKWIRAAQILGCHSIRVNAFGTGSRSDLKNALVDGLGQLAAKGEKEGIHILIENHGLHTSDAAYIVDIIGEVNNPFLGTLPDFGNWCLDTEWGSTQHGDCGNTYDTLKGVAAFLPYAKGVSAKSYQFNSEGNETRINYPELLRLIKKSDFNGHIGIEYEGESLPEPEGIRATKALLERIWGQLE
jgi:sugar phosphate isomerase/epimerase